MTKPWHVYIALLADGRFYAGITQHSPEDRAESHRQGKGGPFTLGVRIVRILWHELHATASSARRRESQIKKWSHEKKRALIHGDLTLLKSLARCRSAHP